MLDSPDEERDPLPSARDLFVGSTEAVLVHDPDDGQVLDANPTAERLYGYDADQLRGQHVSELLAGERTKDTDVTTLADDGRTVRWHVQHPDGERRWLDVRLQRAPTNEYILSFGRDITTEQIQKRALDQREQALETAIDGMAIVDPTLEFVYVNAPFAAMHNYDTPEELIGTNWEQLYDNEEWTRLEQRILSGIEKQGEWRGEAVGQRAGGDSFPKEVSVERLEDEHLVLVVRNVTDLQAREQNLRENQHTLRRLQEIVSQRDVPFETKVDELLELGTEWLGLSVGYMTRISDQVQTVDSAVSDHESIQPGASAPLSETYCQHTVESDDTIRGFEDAVEAGVTDSDEYERFGLSCYLGGTITVDGEDYGTVCFADTEPRAESFTGMEQTFVDLLTQWLGLTIERRQQAEKLRAEHELTEIILESSPTGIIVFGADGRVTMANDRAAAVLDVEAELVGVEGLPIPLYDGTEPVPPAEMPHQRVASGTVLQDVPYRLGDGRDARHVSISGRPLGSGERNGVVLTVEDVTEQQRHSDAMRALSDTLASATGTFDEQLTDLLELGRVHLGLENGHLTEVEGDRHEIVVTDGLPDLLSAGTVSDLSKTFCHSVVTNDDMCVITEASRELTDPTPCEAWGLETYIGTSVTVEDELYGTICFADAARREREFSPWERTFVETLGRWVESQIQQQRNAAERDRDRALLEGVFNSQRTQIGIADTEGNVVDANEAAISFVDSDPEAIVGTPVWDTAWFAEEPARSNCKAAVTNALEGEMTDFEMTYESGPGEETVFSVNVRPVFEDDEVIYVVVEGHDITELREREQELERRQKHIDTILTNAPLVLFALDETGEFLHSRGRALESFGLEDGELVGSSIYDEYEDFPEIIDDYDRARAGEAIETVQPIGETVFRTWYRPVEMGEDTHVIGISIDITEQQRQKERVASVNEAAEEIMYARTPAEVGETLVSIVGELISYPLAGVWIPDDNSESLVPVAATDQTLAAMGGESASQALPQIGPESFEMSVFETGETRVIETYSEMGRNTPIETVVMVPIGEYGVLHVGSPTPKPPSDTELDLIGILARNAEAALVSTTREAELEAHQLELERSNEALQEFAYIASHDLQEPLRMVSSYVDLLASEYGAELDSEASEYMDFAVDGARRMQNMIDALLAYSRVETKGEALEAVDTNAVVDRTLEALQLRIDETNATVSVGPLPTVRGDPNQLGQLFQNLLENAIEYASESGVDPEVRVDAETTDETATVTVSDNGPGIPEGMADKIFEIFKRGGSHDTDGTGIGLAVCRRIVRRHDGQIWAVETDDGGATFTFTLPVSTEVTADE